MTSRSRNEDPTRRNRGFENTHRQLIETAVRLVSQKGADALSIAGLAREMGVNRTTVYYHFDSRDALLRDVKKWSSQQLAKAFTLAAPRQERIDYLTRFVLDNPELIKLWIEDLVSGNDIRQSYPLWDELVAGVAALVGEQGPERPFDAEVFCINLLVGAVVGPRVFHNSIRPEQDRDQVVQRFRQEWQRLLRQAALPEE